MNVEKKYTWEEKNSSWCELPHYNSLRAYATIIDFSHFYCLQKASPQN